MTLDERFSAWLDDELAPAAAAEVELELEADASLAAEVRELAAVRDLLRGAAVEVPPGAIARIVAEVNAVDPHADTDSDRAIAEVVPIRWRRPRVLVAVAASFAIIVGVVGGLGGSTTIPAVGDLIRQHEAAATGSDPATEGDDMMSDAPAMGGMAVAHAAMAAEDVAHFVYEADDGTIVSVFRQDGDADLDGLGEEMGKGEMLEVDGLGMWAADVDAAHVAVVDGDGYVWTIVTDVDHDMSMDMMGELPVRERSLWERVVGIFRLGR